jgi:hypothetical protein
LGVGFDLAIRGRVDIAASPESVWPQLARVERWKSSVVSVEHVEGPAGDVGELLRVGQKSAKETVFVLMRTLSLEAPSLRVQSLATEAGPEVRGYVIYSVDRQPRGCRVTCDLVARCELLPSALDGRPIESLARDITEATRVKLDSDHAALKALIERAAARDAAR